MLPGGFACQTEHSLDAGAGGVVLFGFVTQFYRLSFEEKRRAMAETAEALAGRGLLAVTIMEPSVEGQVALIRAAEALGADMAILQPPLAPPGCNADWPAMLRAVAAETRLPLLIQNAAVAGTALTPDALVRLADEVPHLVGIKAETDSVEVAAFATAHRERFRILTGNWGVEYPFFHAHGAHGLIPAPNFVPEQVALHAALEAGDLARADVLHARVLPVMQFLRERPSVEAQIVLGKHLLAPRLGLPPCGGRAPGPRAPDPRLAIHAERLMAALDAAG